MLILFYILLVPFPSNSCFTSTMFVLLHFTA